MKKRAHEDGTWTEVDDIPIVTGRLWEGSGPPKLKRAHDLEGLPIEEVGTLYALCRDLFVGAWPQIMFGPCVQGAVFELKLDQPPELSMLDGYLTVGIGPPSHFHLCIGPHRGLGRNLTPPSLARARQCRRASFLRLVHPDRGPRSWQIELVNGNDEQMITFFLPSPFLTPDLKPRRDPDWGRLDLWNRLRRDYLGESAPQPIPEGARAGGPCG